jgi:type II secretory pathway predicted ATPase ExeA
MYESFFGFVKRPFLAVSTLDRYFPATSIEQTLQTTSRAIQRGEGPVAIFGGTGLGKTMCCLRIAEHFHRNFEVVMLASSQLITRRALLQSLLFELRMPYRDMSEGELRLTLMNRIQPSVENPTDGLVLIVDEAQTLSMKLLDELRLLTNVVRNGVPRVRLVLCGTMRLEECLSHPHMESMNQRLAARCYLTPLSIQETAQYVTHKIELSGVSSANVMTRDALDAIYRGSDGIPRLIDQLADQSLLLACNDRERPVSAAMVGRAWCMLQQLPNPWSEPESIAKSASTNFPSVDLSSNASNTSKTSYTNVNDVPTNISPASQPIGNSTANSIAIAALQPAIEFGQLDEEFDLDTPSSETSEIRTVPSLTPSATNIQQPTKKSLLDVFGGDFDEEFSIPVQTSGSYQAYSGAAYGNLNHDLSSFGTIAEPSQQVPHFELEQANEFSHGAVEAQRNRLSQSFGAPAAKSFENGPTEYEFSEPISNISPEQALNLERQIEEEMRELVSGLNMSAMSFDPAASIDAFAGQPAFSFDTNVGQSRHDMQRLAHQAHTDVISFSGLRNSSDGFESAHSNTDSLSARSAISDDRDLLVIEDELASVQGEAQQATEGRSRAVLHPYAKLFTKLRNS